VYNNTVPTPNATGPICRGVAGKYPPDAELLRRRAALPDREWHPIAEMN
jgi:hypothetical protein